MAKRSILLLPLCFLLAWLSDFLFWDKPDGISFPIFVVLALAVGFYLAWREGIRPATHSLWLLVPIAFFASVSVVRLEPFTLLLSRTFTLLCMGLLATSFVGGRWLEYSLSDMVAKLVSFVPIGLSKSRVKRADDEEEVGREAGWRHAGAILRGLLLALPVLWILGALLSAADPAFERWLSSIFGWLAFERLGEYLWRITYIAVIGFGLAGVYFYALHNSQDEKLIGEGKPVMASILGFGEAATILGAVELLFIAFVAVQFRYFFGGADNVRVAGYTYAEYARRGFGELVSVAVISLLLFMLLSSISSREGATEKRVFSSMGIALMALVSVMLVSAYQRLLLYESAYGFTRLRTYSHTFMVWLGLLLFAVVILELLGRRRAYGVAMLGAAVGFATSLAILNVDAFIVDANLERARLGYELDVAHLSRLSEDALPALSHEFQLAAEDDSELRVQIAAALACHAAWNDEHEPLPAWQSLHFSRLAARDTWLAISADEAYQALDPEVSGRRSWGFEAQVLGEEFTCQ